MQTLIKVKLLIVSFLIVVSQGQVVQQVPNAGMVNWQDQIIKATGIGAPNPKMPVPAQRAGAIKAAKLNALANLLSTVKGLNVTSETTVENAMVTSDVIRTKVSGTVRNFRVTDTRYLSDGSVEVDVEIPLSGILLDNILPANMGGKSPANVNYGVQAQPGFGNKVYTGLIVDARGLGLRPAMAPRIVDEDGNEIYGSGFVSRDYAVQIGVVGYDKDPNHARNDDRVKDNPLVVKAIGVAGTNKTDIVVSKTDAANILAAGKNLNFMEKCKVMFILD